MCGASQLKSCAMQGCILRVDDTCKRIATGWDTDFLSCMSRGTKNPLQLGSADIFMMT